MVDLVGGNGRYDRHAVRNNTKIMSAKKIAFLLKRALLRDGEMVYALYEHELEEVLDELKSSIVRDKDDYIFTVTENTGHVLWC